MAETLEARREHEVSWRRMRTAEASATSPNLSLELGLGPAINRHSTSPSQSLENLQYIIVGVEEILRGSPIGNEWVREKAPAKEKSPHEATAFDTAQDTQWLRSTLELGMAELAALFGVTRRAVYDWLDGTKTPKAAYIRTVRNLIEEHLAAESRPYLRQFWESAPDGGVSLFEILKSGDPIRLQREALSALVALRRSMSTYASQLAAKPTTNAIANTHTDDIYRSL